MTDSSQWADINLRRNYPFTDASTLKVKTRRIPKEWALDATLVPNREGDIHYYFLSKVFKENNNITLTLSDQVGELATATFDIKSANTHIKFYHKIGQRYAGSLIVNPVYTVALGSFNEGETRIGDKAAVFLPAVVHAMPSPAVTGVKGSSSDQAAVGEVYIVGGDGVTLSRGSGASTIRVDVAGDPNYARYDCDEGQIPYNLQAIKNIVPCVLMNSGTVHAGSPVTADAQGSFMILPSNTQDTDDGSEAEDDMYVGTKPSLRIYPKNGQLYFEIAGLGRSL